MYVCEILDRFAHDLHLAWEPEVDGEYFDETGYFSKRDPAAVEQEMLRWLKGTVGMILDRIQQSAGEEWALNKSLDEPGYQYDGLLWTPIGPRDRTWLDAVKSDPRQGIDLFPWWERGFNARYYLGRALSLMWTQVRWRPPITDEEKALLATVIKLLEQAHAADPDLDLPWAEWEELNRFANRSDSLATRVGDRARQAGSAATIGYRRRPVRATAAGGWSIEIPGSYAELRHPDGSWQAFDDRIVVYLSSINVSAKLPDAPLPAAEELVRGVPLGPGVEEYSENGLIGRAHFSDEKTLKGVTAVPGALAVSLINITSPEDREAATRIWRSIRRVKG